MVDTHQDISVAEFLSVSIFLAEECGKIIREVQESGDLGRKDKSDESPVTMADLRVQKTLEENFKALYPTLNVQGEESKESIADIQGSVSPDQITEQVKTFVAKDYLAGKHVFRMEWIKETLSKTYDETDVSTEPFETFNTKDAVVWIDPLDGTSDFVKGNLPACTVLIGVSINGKSRLGIVHKPFSDDDQSVGNTVFGAAEFGVFKMAYDKEMT
jgi:3'(2'), 5'-bisphosphate nucleotidase